ncbi:MAG: ribosomal protein methylthiotransferase [Thermosediminibacterales bacterium]|nr:ribosomal protein methylthiotransferase [Thermosediminibacterales bacterium]
MQSFKVGFISLGCDKNLIDSEIMLGLLQKEGFSFTRDPKDAQILVVNTCGFIEDAKQESIDTIFELINYKKLDKNKKIIVTGCLAQRYKDELLDQIGEIDALIGTMNYTEIVNVIKQCINGKHGLNLTELQNEFCYPENLPRVSTAPKHTVYIKVAEGCNNRCTYCVIPLLRGSYKSRHLENILNEIRRFANSGAKEIILIAQDTTQYGIDLYGEYKLPELIESASKISGVEWIRLLYCYPQYISEELINTILNNDKICRYLDIPLQHINNDILKKMGRKTTKTQIKNLIAKLRKKIPGIVLRTTFIVGFPGETEEEFEELLDFVREVEFDKLGVFSYSQEGGTPAALMPLQVSKSEKIKRYNKLMKLQKDISRKKNENLCGKTFKVLVEGFDDEKNMYYGRTYRDAPEIDGEIFVKSDKKIKIGSFVHAKIIKGLDYDLIGEVLDES